jgi:hypothetical protein
LANSFVEPLMLRSQLAEVLVGSEQRVFCVDRRFRELRISHARLLGV